jgi:hypothetical protein
MPEPTCLGFHVECGIMVKGILGVTMGIVVFVGSVYVLLTAVFGRWMAYLVIAVSFFGWLIIHSSIWFFGYYSQGPKTPTNLGPRGREPAWTIVSSGLAPEPVRYTTFSTYPKGAAWREPGTNDADIAAVQGVTGVIQNFLVESANEQLGYTELDPRALQATQFTVEDVRFATAPDGKTPLAAAHAFFSGGGPVFTVEVYHDSGAIPHYSVMFLGGSVLLFALHLPLLDRAEKKRKAFLVGGTAPPWYGPA